MSNEYMYLQLGSIWRKNIFYGPEMWNTSLNITRIGSGSQKVREASPGILSYFGVN